MGVRSGLNPEELSKIRDNAQKHLLRTYVLWLLGLIVGALEIQPVGFNAAGLSLKIDKPEAVQGILYLACLFSAYVTLLSFYASDSYMRPTAIRRLIFNLLPRGKRTLKNFTREQWLAIKRKVALRIRFSRTNVYVIILIPPAIIIFRHWRAVQDAWHLIRWG